MAFRHGVYTSQVPTSLVPSANVNASLAMAFGTAPIHRLSPELQEKVKPGNIVLIFSNAEASEMLGIDSAKDDFQKWGLSEVAFSHFSLFNVAPVIFANIFDPAIHKTDVTGEVLTFSGEKGNFTTYLANPEIVGDVQIGNFSKEDFSIDIPSGFITVKPGSLLEDKIIQSIESQTADIIASYAFAVPNKCTANDCIGGYDPVTGITTGLELVEQAYPRFRMAPGILLAPNFSRDPSVAALLAAKCVKINDVFNAVAFVDISDEAVTKYSDVPAYKNSNNIVSEDLYVCWPRVKFGDRAMNMSTQAAGIMAQVDDANGNLPFVSPSNKNLQCQSVVVGDTELWLDLPKANSLNANGIATALNFANGWVLWGNRTAAYPGQTDSKDVFISNRRMLAWYGNRLVLTYFQRVDFPINNRLIQTILNSEQIFINSLVATGALTGGRIEFTPSENPLTSLMDGKITFHVYLGLVAPAEEINFLLEFDPTYLESLFA